MALTPAPHTPPVFRVLKQAFRDYCASGGAQVLAVTAPPNQLVAATTPVSGTLSNDVSVPTPVLVTVELIQSAVTVASKVVAAAAGAFSATFPGSLLAAGTATVRATTIYGPAVTSTAFTVT